MTQQREEHVYPRSQKDGANKDYNQHLEQDAGGAGLWRLLYENGKHGAALKRKEKIEGAASYDQATKVFDQTLKEKMSTKGRYVPQTAGVEYQSLVPARPRLRLGAAAAESHSRRPGRADLEGAG